MKKTLLLIALACLAGSVCLAQSGRTVAFDKLPQSSREFIGKYFPRHTVASVELDRSRDEKYDVKFTDGGHIYFEKGGDWSGIALTVHAVPNDLVPLEIRTYVMKTYPREQIRGIMKNGSGTLISLSNGQKLQFDSSNKLVKLG